jgi:hypothetical protein
VSWPRETRAAVARESEIAPPFHNFAPPAPPHSFPQDSRRRCSVAEKCHEFVCRHVSFHCIGGRAIPDLCLGAGKYDATRFLSVMTNIKGEDWARRYRGARPGPAYPIHSLHANERESKSATGKSPFCAVAKSDCSISKGSIKKAPARGLTSELPKVEKSRH